MTPSITEFSIKHEAMQKIFLHIFVTLFVVMAITQFESSAANRDDSGIAMHGFDPVSYHLNGPQKGKIELFEDLDGVRYLFSSDENRNLFLVDNQKYIPAYGGWCAWAMLTGQKVDIDPYRFKIINGITYLFYNSFFIDTLKKWNNLASEKNDLSLVKKADDHWMQLTEKKGLE